MSTKIIADACSNHLGQKILMEQMIKEAAEIGIDFIKFQSFKADYLNKRYPDYETMYKYYKSVELKDNDYTFILEKCREYNIKPMLTIFHVDLIEKLYNLGVRNIKIASPDAENLYLVKSCLETFDNVYVSNGMSSNYNIKELFKTRAKIFYCISKYPTKLNDIDFDIMQLFNGFSDHTIGIEASKKAIDFNMEYIERHFTLGKNLPGKDHFISSTVDEFKELVDYRNYKESIKKYKTRWTNE